MEETAGEPESDTFDHPAETGLRRAGPHSPAGAARAGPAWERWLPTGPETDRTVLPCRHRENSLWNTFHWFHYRGHSHVPVPASAPAGPRPGRALPTLPPRGRWVPGLAMGQCLPCMGDAVKDVVETPDPVSEGWRGCPVFPRCLSPPGRPRWGERGGGDLPSFLPSLSDMEAGPRGRCGAPGGSAGEREPVLGPRPGLRRALRPGHPGHPRSSGLGPGTSCCSCCCGSVQTERNLLLLLWCAPRSQCVGIVLLCRPGVPVRRVSA